MAKLRCYFWNSYFSQDILALSNLNDELTTKGYSERTFRFLCHSESKEVRWLLVLTKIYPFINQHGEFILVSYAWPFGYARDQLGSFEQNQDTMDNLQFIKTHEGWLSLVPSFFRELANQPSRNSTEQSNSQPTYPHPGNPPRPPGHPRSIWTLTFKSDIRLLQGDRKKRYTAIVWYRYSVTFFAITLYNVYSIIYRVIMNKVDTYSRMIIQTPVITHRWSSAPGTSALYILCVLCVITRVCPWLCRNRC